MSAEENTQTAKDGYAAFGRGDVPAILELLTDGIEWVDPGPPDVLPGAGTHRGKEAGARSSQPSLRRRTFTRSSRGSSSRKATTWLPSSIPSPP
jgi:ketosteroid isomerase-like protein